MQLRLALALPVAQVIVAGILEFYTPDFQTLPLIRQICWGINSPALLVRSFGMGILQRVLPVGNTIPIDTLCFLASVFLLWYLVGRTLDRRMAGLPVAPQGRDGFVVLGLSLLLGIYLGLQGLVMHERFVGRNPYALLIGTWGVILMVGSVSGIAARFRTGPAPLDPSGTK